MVDLPTLANLAEIIGAATVIGGIAFAAFQIREFRRKHAEEVTLEVLRTMQGTEIRRAAQLLWEVPDGLSAEEFCAKEGVEEAFIALATMFETLGFMVHRRLVSLDVVVQLMGRGAMQVHWRKGRRYIEDVRAEGYPYFFEWFQWLVEQVERDHPAGTEPPAYAAHRDWTG